MERIIDVSSWQGTINWPETSADMAVLRASAGMVKDSAFKENARACHSLRIPFGVYHYVTATNAADCERQMELFYNTAQAEKPGFWVLDIEYPDLLYENGQHLPMRKDFTELVRTMYNALRKKVGAAKIVYYGGASVYGRYGGLSVIPFDALWIADYGINNGTVTSSPSIACDMQQYTSRGRVPGIATNVDLNRLLGQKGATWWSGSLTDVNVDNNGDGMIVHITRPTVWNIRTGPGTQYAATGSFAQVGNRYDWLATAWNGWLAIPLEGEIGWISPQAASVERI